MEGANLTSLHTILSVVTATHDTTSLCLLKSFESIRRIELVTLAADRLHRRLLSHGLTTAAWSEGTCTSTDYTNLKGNTECLPTMLEVAPPVAIGLWDKPWAWSASHGPVGCIPIEPQHYQSGPYINLQSFWSSIAPRTRESRGSMRLQPSFALSVQPNVTKPRKRRRSAPRSQGNRRTPETPTQLHRPNETGFSQPEETVEQPTAASREPVLGGDTTSAASDTLFSSIASESGQPYDSKNLCDLCRLPFEAKEDALHGHLSKHLRELGGLLSCDKCNISFSHMGDLKWHLQSAEHRDITDDTRRSTSCFRLRNWEQAQLLLHSQTIDKLYQSRSKLPPRRPASVPPRPRKPLDSVTIGESSARFQSKSSNLVTDDDHVDTVNNPLSDAAINTELDVTEVRTSRDDSTDQGVVSQEHMALHSLQRRIRDLMEQIHPTSPDEQATPYSEFCDSHSLPGSPEQLSKDGSETKVDRALSEPPLRTSLAGEGPKQTAPYYASGNGYGTSGVVWNSTSSGQGQKRGSDGRDFGQLGEDDGDGNGTLQPKKRKTAGGNSEVEKRFPCIYHIGDPVQFKTDVARHRHISNMW